MQLNNKFKSLKLKIHEIIFSIYCGRSFFCNFFIIFFFKEILNKIPINFDPDNCLKLYYLNFNATQYCRVINFNHHLPFYNKVYILFAPERRPTKWRRRKKFVFVSKDDLKMEKYFLPLLLISRTKKYHSYLRLMCVVYKTVCKWLKSI